MLFAYRVSKQKSTGYSPFYMMFHRQPSLPIDFDMLEVHNASDVEPDYDAFIEKMTSIRENVKETASRNIDRAQNEQKKHYDRRHSTEACISSCV